MMNELLVKRRSNSTSVPVTRQRTIQAISRSQLPKEAELLSAGIPSHSPSAKIETCNYLSVLTQSLCSSHQLEYCRAIGEYNSDRACHAQHEKRSQSCYLQSARRIGMATATSRVQTHHHARCRRTPPYLQSPRSLGQTHAPLQCEQPAWSVA